jgi:hypothetical protein
MASSLLERIGLATPKAEVSGTVARIGFVCNGSEVEGYYGIQFVDQDQVHKIFAVRGVAETLALTLPGETLTLTVKEHANFSECVSAVRGPG